MRLSTTICLLIVVCCVISSSAKRVNIKSKRNRPKEVKKNVKKEAQKEVTTPPSSSSSDEEEEEENKYGEQSVYKRNKNEPAESDVEDDESSEDDEESSDEEESDEDSGHLEDEDDEEDDDDVEEEDENEDDDDDDETEDDASEEESESGDDGGEENTEEEKSETDDEVLRGASAVYWSSEVFKGDLREEIKEKGIFYSVESVKNYFKTPDLKGDKEIVSMLEKHAASEALVQEKIAANPGTPFAPFYVVEGVDPDTRRKVAQILAHRVKGLYFVNQPRVLLGPVLKDDAGKKAYYSLAKYMIANKVKQTLFSKPIVTESYWMEHASYIMAKVWDKASDLPKPGSEVYKFPEDLLVPNITFAIFNSPLPRIGKKASKSYLFEQRQLLVYKRFTGAKIYIIRFPESPKLIADKIDLILHGMDYKYRKPLRFNIEVIEDDVPPTNSSALRLKK